jgi:hypothetical protein
MSLAESVSTFKQYYAAEPFVDRFKTQREAAVDVIIPIIHANELWRTNLLSIYREIPVNRLILGDGGCIDGSIDVAHEFPRVCVLDHRSFTSLGYSICRLIDSVETEWFVYLHSDVMLPPGWFEAMNARRDDYDWFECNQRITIMADYMLDTTKIRRAYSGSQMGRKAAFASILRQVDDDFLYRNEDIILATLIAKNGFRYGKAGDTFHFHQVMAKPSPWQRNIARVSVDLDVSREEDMRANRTYAQGIIKYMNPSDTTPDIIASVRYAIWRLMQLNDPIVPDLREWIRRTNPVWLESDEIWPSVRRERIADRIVAIAEVYRLQGASQAVRPFLRWVFGPLVSIKHRLRQRLAQLRRN